MDENTIPLSPNGGGQLVRTTEQGCPLPLPECHALKSYRLSLNHFYLLFVGFICVYFERALFYLLLLLLSIRVRFKSVLQIPYSKYFIKLYESGSSSLF